MGLGENDEAHPTAVAEAPKLTRMERNRLSDLVASIERATLAAVAPVRVTEQSGWLIPTSPGSLRRAKSAAPLRHPGDDAFANPADAPGPVSAVVETYQQAGHQPLLRLPLGNAVLESAAVREGLSPSGCNAVMVGHTLELLQRASRRTDRTGSSPLVVHAGTEADTAWQSLFLGPGFDPVDGQCRIEHLSRSPCNRFFTAWWAEEPVACGAAALSHGWFSAHGMRTSQAHRGKGLATAVLRAMAEFALEQGYGQAFLQVEAENAAAVSLYQGLGLQTAWSYAYWQPNPRG